MSTQEELAAYQGQVLDAYVSRFGKIYCAGCDYAVPLVPDTNLCADCVSPGLAVGMYREMKRRAANSAAIDTTKAMAKIVYGHGGEH